MKRDKDTEVIDQKGNGADANGCWLIMNAPLRPRRPASIDVRMTVGYFGVNLVRRNEKETKTNDHLGTRREDKDKDTSAGTEGHDMNKIPLDGVSAFLST